MSLEEKSTAVSALSGITIDVDKNWLAFGISNLKEIAAGMQLGDMVYFDGAGLVKFTPGPIGTLLTTQGVGANPNWTHP